MKYLYLFILSAAAYGQSLPFGGIPVTISVGPTVAFVNGCVNSASALTTSCTLSVTSGNLLVVSSKTQNSTGTGAIVVSNTGATCTWNRAIPTSPLASGTPFNSSVYTCIAGSTASTPVTVTWSGTTSGPFTDISVAQYSTSATWNNPVLDRSIQSANTTASTSCATGTTPATQNPNDLLLAICQNFNSAQTWGTLTGYTNRATSSRNTLGVYDKAITSAGAQSTTIPLSASDSSQGALIAFQASNVVNCASCALVQSTDSANQTPQHDQIALSGVVPGDTLVYYVYHSNWSGSGTTTMADSGGNIWQRCGLGTTGSTSVTMTDLQVDSTHGMACFYSLVVSAGGTVTGQPVASDCTVSCTLIGGWFAEIKGATNWDAFASTVSGTASSGSNNATCGSLTTTQANDFVFCSTYPDAGFSSVGTSPLALTQSNSVNGPAGYAIDSASGSISPTMTYTSGTAYGGMTVAFK